MKNKCRLCEKEAWDFSDNQSLCISHQAFQDEKQANFEEIEILARTDRSLRILQVKDVQRLRV